MIHRSSSYLSLLCSSSVKPLTEKGCIRSDLLNKPLLKSTFTNWSRGSTPIAAGRLCSVNIMPITWLLCDITVDFVFKSPVYDNLSTYATSCVYLVEGNTKAYLKCKSAAPNNCIVGYVSGKKDIFA